MTAQPRYPRTTPDIRQAWSSLPPADAVDVLVVGGGPAGCAAAIAAAREGVRTLLVEQHAGLGGMGTVGLVPAFCPYTNRKETIIRGIALDVLEEMKAGMPHIAPDHLDWVPIDAERLKAIYERRVSQAGGRILFLTHFIDVIERNAGRINAAIIHNKSGLQRIDVGVVVDCTGDGDVAVAAGAEYAQGDDDTGETQPCTMCFVLAGVDNQRFQDYLWADDARNLLLKPAIAAAKAAGDLDIPEDACNVAYQSASTVGFNFSHVFDVDATDAVQLSAAHIEGRRLIRRLTDFVRKYCPGCEQAYLVTSGAQIGVRETRRILGDCVLTLDDYLGRRSFPDEIARNSYYIDIHLSPKAGSRRPAHGTVPTHQYAPGESHGIPYRCLTPRGLHNLLTAGRCISTDRAVQGSVRVMPNCLATGEAAGCAAALAAAHHAGDVRGLDAARLRNRLREHGQYLPDAAS